MSLVLKSNKRALKFISSDPRLPTDYSLMLNFEGNEYKNGSGIAVNPKSYINYVRQNTATIINDDGTATSLMPDSLAIIKLTPSEEQGLYLAGVDEDSYVPIFTSPMNGGEVTYNIPNLKWNKYQFAMLGSGKATITITLPNGITMTKYPSSIPSTGNQLVIDEANPTACVFSGSGAAWSIKVEATGRVDQVFITRKSPSGDFMMMESSKVIKPSSTTPSTLRTANVNFNNGMFSALFSNGAKTGSLVFSMYVPVEKNIAGLIGANSGWLMAMLFSDGSDVSCNAYTNPREEPDKITRYRINDKTTNTEKALRLMPDRMLTIAVSFDNGVVKIACNNKYYNEATLSPGINISDINFGAGVWGTAGYAKGNLMIRKIYTYERALSTDELMKVSALFQ